MHPSQQYCSLEASPAPGDSHSLPAAPDPRSRPHAQPSFDPQIFSLTLCKKQTRVNTFTSKGLGDAPRPAPLPIPKIPSSHSVPLRKQTKFQQLFLLYNKLQRVF